MPISNETRDILLFLTGEVYSDSSLINSLRQSGHQFDPNDASYLVHLFEEDEQAFFKTLNGWYNGIILDLVGNRNILFNDRYGVRRLYYSEIDSGLVFSSEAKALLSAHPSLRNLNHKSIGEYLVYDCVLENRTFFDKINLLPPGSAWFCANGNVEKTRYHDPRGFEEQTQLSPEDFTDRFIDTFKNVLPRYFMGKTAGLSLTGGLDTRSILACTNPAPGQLPCYTFGGQYRDIYDIRIAPLVAQACKQPYSILAMDDEQYLKSYPESVERMIYVSDGTGSVVDTDMLHFNKMARQISPVRMTGKYGSQVLKHVLGFQDRPPYEQLIHGDYRHFLTEARETCRSLYKDNEFSFFLYSELPWWWNGIIAVESSQVNVRSPFLDNDIVKLIYQAPVINKNAGEQIQLKLIARNSPTLLKIPSTSAHREGASYIRRKAMKYLIIADKLYVRERLPYGLTHKVAKIDRFLGPLHIERWVVGLLTFRRNRTWFRDQLSQYLLDTLLCPTTYNRPFWDKASLDKFLKDHIAGKGTYLREIRKALQLELLCRVFVDSFSSMGSFQGVLGGSRPSPTNGST
jgi:asparagine synthase (glutamine-hydrolysing)